MAEWNSCFDCKSTKNLRAIHNQKVNDWSFRLVVSTAKVQKIWEQFTTKVVQLLILRSCFDCKSTKNLRAIHNCHQRIGKNRCVVSTAKVQKIWEQFTTRAAVCLNSLSCFDCKSTKNLRAIHNTIELNQASHQVVSTAKVQKIWEQFTTPCCVTIRKHGCFDCKSTKNLRAIHNG